MFSKRSLCILYSILVLLPMGACHADTFFEAAARGNMGLIKSMLKGSPALVKTVDNDGATALHYAAATGKRTVAEFLLTNGADVNARKKDGVTPLHVAAALGQKDMAEFLIYKKAGIDSVDNKGRTPLTLSRERRHPMVAKLLLAAGAKDASAAPKPQPRPKPQPAARPIAKAPTPALPKTPDKKLVETSMDAEAAGFLTWTAACKGDTDKIKSLLMSAAGPNLVNYETKDGRMTPLQGAASYGKLDAARMLILQGAEINHKDANGTTPLHLAAFHGFTKVANILLSRDADLNARDRDGETPIHMAASGGHAETVTLLVAKGASVDTKDNTGLTPLHEAAINGHTHMVKLLMQKGADKEARDNAGHTALEYAQLRNHPATAEVLSTLTNNPAESIAPAEKPAPEKPVVTIKKKPVPVKTPAAAPKKPSQVKAPIAAPAPAKAPAAIEKKPAPAKILVPTVEKKPVQAKAPVALVQKTSLAPKPKAVAKALPALPSIAPYEPAPTMEESLDFFEAVANGDSVKVRKLLAARSSKVLVNTKDKEGLMPIHWAVLNGKADIIQMLVKNGSDVNAKTANKLNLFHQGKNMTFDAGTTPKMLAEKIGNKEAIKMLKSAGAR